MGRLESARLVGGERQPYIVPQRIEVSSLREETTVRPLSDIQPIIYSAIRELVFPDVIKASSGLGEYARPFGRDTAISIQLFVEAQDKFGTNYVKRRELADTLMPLVESIALEDRPSHGVRRGQFPHEKGTHAQGFPADWEIGPDGVGVNYDTVDAPGRAILVMDKYLREYPEDKTIQDKYLPAVSLLTEWAINNTREHDGLIGYTGAEDDTIRKAAGAKGLKNFTWQDCNKSIVDKNGDIPQHPIMPVEEQPLTWEALNKAADLLENSDPSLSLEARIAAKRLKQAFNEKFIFEDETGRSYIARAIDGKGEQIRTVNIDNLIALGYKYKGESIITDERINADVIKRSMDELYTPVGGLRTQSPYSIVHKDHRYHGPTAYWPHANIMAARALLSEKERVIDKNPLLAQQYHEDALAITYSTMAMLLWWQSPVETFHIYSNGKIDLFRTQKPDGREQTSAWIQAWVMAAAAWAEGFLRQNNIETIIIPSRKRELAYV